jgi:hypothetical protein
VARPKAGEPSPSAGEVRRPQGDGSRQGTVIAAFVRARLLGLQILTLDARVALVSADTDEELPTVARRTNEVPLFAPGLAQSRMGQPANLAYAVRLLEEGSKSLDEVRGGFRGKP